MEARYFDIHAHLDFPEYDTDRTEVIYRTIKEAVMVNTVGTNSAGNRAAVSLAKEHEHIYATVGFHPNDLAEVSPVDWLRLEEMIATEKKVVAVGECGLDYFRLEGDSQKTKDAQREALLRQIELASRYQKAVMVHTRPTKGRLDAYWDTVDFLAEEVRPRFPDLKINLHCFSGDEPVAKKLLDLGCTLSFTGVVTFARDYDEVIKLVPVTSLMAETDAPFLSPAPFRGERNEPIRVALVVETLARIRGEEVEILAGQILANSRHYFDL